jgi:hypothetical protein
MKINIHVGQILFIGQILEVYAAVAKMGGVIIGSYFDADKKSLPDSAAAADWLADNAYNGAMLKCLWYEGKNTFIMKFRYHGEQIRWICTEKKEQFHGYE